MNLDEKLILFINNIKTFVKEWADKEKPLDYHARYELLVPPHNDLFMDFHTHVYLYKKSLTKKALGQELDLLKFSKCDFLHNALQNAPDEMETFFDESTYFGSNPVPVPGFDWRVWGNAISLGIEIHATNENDSTPNQPTAENKEQFNERLADIRLIYKQIIEKAGLRGLYMGPSNLVQTMSTEVKDIFTRKDINEYFQNEFEKA